MQAIQELLLSFPPATYLMAMAYLIFEASPLIFSSVVAVRHRSTMRRKLLYVGAVSVITYGVFLFLFALIGIPLSAFLVFFVPALKEQGYLQNSYVLSIADFVYRWWWLLLPPALAAVATVVTRYLGKRWNGIVNALQG